MKRGLGVAFVMSGLIAACVAPMQVDSEGTDTGGAAQSGAAGQAKSTFGGAVGTSGAGGRSAWGGTSGEASRDAGALCPFSEASEYDPEATYPFCNGTETFEFDFSETPSSPDRIQERCRSKVPGSITGAGRHAFSSSDDDSIRYCLCLDDCEVDADCPAGDSGSALPVCIEGYCHLACDDGEACPDRMTCTQDHESEHRVCMWATRGDGCDTSTWPNVSQ